jgi:hypothetical protein
VNTGWGTFMLTWFAFCSACAVAAALIWARLEAGRGRAVVARRCRAMRPGIDFDPFYKFC